MSSAQLPDAQRHQELAYPGGHDYRQDSPHLKHHRVYEALLARVRRVLEQVADRGLPLTVLDIGAGDGAFVEPLLASGCSVTAVEMSRPAIHTLHTLFGRNEAFDAVFDEDGSLEAVGERRFSVLLFASVLHHIPDYDIALARAVERHLAPRGSVITLQDPLWYPRLPRVVHTLSEVAFLSWRVRRGNLLRGAASRARRVLNRYDEDNPSDAVEYHVVRDGVDEEAVRALLGERFAQVDVIRYWSTFAAGWQSIGEHLPLANTFAVVADDLGGNKRRS